MGLIETILQVHYNDFAPLFTKPFDSITVEDLCKAFVNYVCKLFLLY